ncbi:MAG: hypothetical protein CVV23_14170 [Ignavibacteriae bacterium HGW-Ignavibacteriae-2]|nr:MAG: hypothetical protein CVV23_14170 [Ignavibacteriae bacterium HGW-Ignavibacteriae-2]
MIVVFCILIFATSMKAQISNSVSKVNISDVIENKPVKISVSFIPVTGITNVVLAYKMFDETEFKQYDMEMMGDSAIYTIPANMIRSPYFSYYLSIYFENGNNETYPLGIPETGLPLEVMVKSVSAKENEVLVLTPSSNDKITTKDLLISVSFVRAPDIVDVKATQVFLNDENITENFLFAGDLMLFNSNNFPGLISTGTKSLRIESYDNSGELYITKTMDFKVLSEAELNAAKNQFNYKGTFEAESRNQSYNDNNTWFNNSSLRLTGKYDQLKFGGYVYVTSEEQKDRQPRNRFSGSVDYKEWFSLKFGDTYPRLPNLILNGRRVRGLEGSLNFGFFNITTTLGQIKRNIEGKIIETYDRDNAPLGSNIIEIDSTKYGNPYAMVTLGTFDRQIFAIRPSFGSGENFQWGFSYLHSKDDTKSIEFGGRAQENVVVGTDMNINLDDRNIIFKSQAAVSLLNSNISIGEITQAQIDSLAIEGDGKVLGIDKDQFVSLKDIVSGFITFNQNIGPLNPEKLSSLATESLLELNYFDNKLRGSYIYRGNGYKSFGQDFIMTDRKGFNISDRVNLIDNQLFVSLGYESLQDNLQNTQVSTITYNNLNTSVSYYPRFDFPAVTLSYRNRTRSNDLKPADSLYSIYNIDDNTDTYMAKLSYDFTAGVKHNSNFSISNINYNDNSTSKLSQKFLTTSFGLSSWWMQNLSSYFGLTYYSSTSDAYEYTYTALTFGSNYRMLQNKLNLSLNISPSFGDFEKYGFDFLASYLIIENLTVSMQMRYFNLPGISSNSVAGLRLRYSI